MSILETYAYTQLTKRPHGQAPKKTVVTGAQKDEGKEGCTTDLDCHDEGAHLIDHHVARQRAGREDAVQLPLDDFLQQHIARGRIGHVKGMPTI